MRNIDCSMGRGWEAPCSPCSEVLQEPVEETRGLAGLDPRKGRTGKLRAQDLECYCTRDRGPWVTCHMCDTGALDQPMSPHAPGCCMALLGSSWGRSPAPSHHMHSHCSSPALGVKEGCGLLPSAQPCLSVTSTLGKPQGELSSW